MICHPPSRNGYRVPQNMQEAGGPTGRNGWINRGGAWCQHPSNMAMPHTYPSSPHQDATSRHRQVQDKDRTKGIETWPGAITGKRGVAQQTPSTQPSAAIEMVSANGRIDLGVGCASLRPPARKTPHQARCRFPSKLEKLQKRPTARQQQKTRAHSERGFLKTLRAIICWQQLWPEQKQLFSWKQQP